MLKKGLLIVLEGSDGAGKETQSKKLLERLKSEGYKVMRITFPNYENKSSTLVKMYLNGELGKEPEKINPFAVSSFYACDRFISFEQYKDFYENGGIIIADRYTTSNMLYQASKFKTKAEKDIYLDWLWDLEFNKFKLPIPDKVIFLDVPPEVSKKLVKNRLNKITNNKNKDIHENDSEFINNAYNNALYITQKYGWHRINCIKNKILRNIDDIHQEIYSAVIKLIKENSQND